MFITTEGIDGCGKTTQLELLRAHLESELSHLKSSTRIVQTREPGGTDLAETIRNYLLHSPAPLHARAELLLFGASRAQHVEEIIRPAINRGDWVLCDRFIDSTTAYQGGGLGLGTRFIKELNAFATGKLFPDLTLLFDVEVDVAQSRRSIQRGTDKIEARGLEFQENVRQTYLQIARDEPNRVVVVDASAPAKVVHNCVVRILKEKGLWPQLPSN
ncbi:MAG TPA: dTMP kinase [Abditibacteriaceae bacterium]|jgi:dTMP kinase|nr:dTMP kinase [Abditibacteriaceae bacterium]